MFLISTFSISSSFFFSLHPPFARWQARKEEWALCHFCFLDRHLHNTWPVHGFPWTVVQVHNEDANRFARTAVIFVSRPSCPLSLLEHVFQAAILATPLIFLPDILPRVSSSPKKRKTKKRESPLDNFETVIADKYFDIDRYSWALMRIKVSLEIEIQCIWKFIREFWLNFSTKTYSCKMKRRIKFLYIF